MLRDDGRSCQQTECSRTKARLPGAPRTMLPTVTPSPVPPPPLLPRNLSLDGGSFPPFGP